MEDLSDLSEHLQRLLQVLGDHTEVLQQLLELSLCHLFRVLLADLSLGAGALHYLPQVGNTKGSGDIVESVQTQSFGHSLVRGIPSDDNHLDRRVDRLRVPRSAAMKWLPIHSE
jgi:hypothetical protein